MVSLIDKRHMAPLTLAALLLSIGALAGASAQPRPSEFKIEEASSAAALSVDQLKPKRFVLPMHYGVEGYPDLLGAKYFLDEFKADQVKKMPTNELLVDPKAKAPGEPVIVLLKWN